MIRDQNRKLLFMRKNRFFSELTSTKLHKMSYYLKNIKLTKGQVVYKEGDPIDGFYLIMEGAVKYTKLVNYLQPIQSQTSNKWFTAQAK